MVYCVKEKPFVSTSLRVAKLTTEEVATEVVVAAAVTGAAVEAEGVSVVVVVDMKVRF